MELKSGDIVLRTLNESDAPKMAELANNIKVARNLRDGFPYPYTLKDAEIFIEKYGKTHPMNIFAIEYQGEYAGNISLMPGTDVYRKSAEIGYFIGEAFWNKGIVSTAVNLITEYGFKFLDIVRIHCGIFEYNTASQRVLEKCGFVKEGIFKKAVFKENRFWDEIRYAKLV
ncbi:MAG: GNAT family N-acetyltransferase [Ferruginibacter sp.]